MEFDPNTLSSDALNIALVGYFTVFASLLALFIVFYYLPKLIKRIRKKTLNEVALSQTLQVDEASGEVNAAIAAAIHLYMEELHDEENMVITIGKIAKSYSPWSSKIYATQNWKR